jgi:hypothetical protein
LYRYTTGGTYIIQWAPDILPDRHAADDLVAKYTTSYGYKLGSRSVIPDGQHVVEWLPSEEPREGISDEAIRAFEISRGGGSSRGPAAAAVAAAVAESSSAAATAADDEVDEKGGNGQTSKFAGVSWYKRENKWRATMSINGKQVHLGYHVKEEDAARAYMEYGTRNDINAQKTPPKLLLRVERFSSRVRGVTWNKRDRKWQAQLAGNLGYFRDEKDAPRRYNDEVRKLGGPADHRLNDIGDEDYDDGDDHDDNNNGHHDDSGGATMRSGGGGGAAAAADEVDEADEADVVMGDQEGARAGGGGGEEVVYEDEEAMARSERWGLCYTS